MLIPTPLRHAAAALLATYAPQLVALAVDKIEGKKPAQPEVK